MCSPTIVSTIVSFKSSDFQVLSDSPFFFLLGTKEHLVFPSGCLITLQELLKYCLLFSVETQLCLSLRIYCFCVYLVLGLLN